MREAEALLRSAPAAMAASSDTPPAASGGQRPPRPAAAPSPVATSAPGTPRVGTPAAGAASPRAGAPETPPGGALLGLDKRGKLKKQRDIFRGWRERYFVLDGKMLWYYESKSEHYPKGSIYLESDCEVIPWPEGRKGDARKLFTFRICHPPSKLEYRLGADSQEEMDSVRSRRRCAPPIPLFWRPTVADTSPRWRQCCAVDRRAIPRNPRGAADA